MADKPNIFTGHRKVVRAADLKVGMHVCELDRPWLELPFEPPFQLQGFRIKSNEEIQKIRQYCSHVYIDTERTGRKRTSGKNRRRIAFTTGLFKVIRSGLMRRRASNNSMRAEQVASQPAFRLGGHGSSGDQGNRGEIQKLYHSETDYNSLPPKYGALAPDAPERVDYQNQTTFEEEYEPAKLAINEASGFYSDLVKEVQNNKQLDYPKLREKVDTMASSIIRNPDALSYLVQMKSLNSQTYQLAISSCVMVMAFARFLGLPNTDIEYLGAGALLHDVGMVKLPSELIDKQGPLSDTELKLMQRHVSLSRGIVEGIPGIPKKVISVCYCHHERYDGSGYPRGLRKNQIPLFSMITGVVDTYMALTSFRAYRQTRTSYEALCELAESRDKQFLGALVDRFIQYVAIFPVGSFVQLNSGHVGVVVTRNPMRLLEPEVMLVLDPDGNKLDQELTINFASEQKGRFYEGLRIKGEVIPGDYGIDADDYFA